MTEAYCTHIANELGIITKQVAAVESLLADGSTIPFIARYRKEQTGSLDEVAIGIIRNRLVQLAELDKRREAIQRSLEERDLLTDELLAAIKSAETLAELEDIYLPYRPKRRTRATIAKEKGLEPLAKIILSQKRGTDIAREAAAFVSEEKGVGSAEDALSGARDIIAEWVSEDADTRKNMRELFTTKGDFQCKLVKGKEEEGAKYRDYFDSQESVSKAPSHRVHAMLRGENEGYLKLSIRPSEERSLTLLRKHFVKSQENVSEQVTLALDDSYKRLLGPSMETEVRREAKEAADEEAIRVFAQNLRERLMSAPLGQKTVLAIDPGYRTGSKVVCLDRQGKLLHTTVIYPTQSAKKSQEAAQTIIELVERFNIEAIAIGNGTASRETETLIRSLNFPNPVMVIVVDENGASVYSASQVAREEFPDHDVTVRGSVSIGRRLMDPLSELVKIDPKAIGVGQYQHDVDSNKLRDSLDDVVMSCVNSVGVEVNTASKQLLAYVSGLSPTLAKNIVEYRDQNGPFKNRGTLKNVPRLGPKAWEQAIGFLRIHNAENPLDASAVHPESYHIINSMTQDLNCSVQDLMQKTELCQNLDLDRYVSDKVGLPTLIDIVEEIAKPGRDPRDKFEAFSFSEQVNNIDDVAEGMKLPGIITNVTNFGAFVDIGIHQDGLVHISEMADHFVKSPNDIVKLHQHVQVTVLEVDKDRKRIQLSMKENPLMSKPASLEAIS